MYIYVSKRAGYIHVKSSTSPHFDTCYDAYSMVGHNFNELNDNQSKNSFLRFLRYIFVGNEWLFLTLLGCLISFVGLFVEYATREIYASMYLFIFFCMFNVFMYFI